MLIEAAKATGRFARHPISTTCENVKVAQRLGFKGTVDSIKAPAFNLALELSALVAIPYGLAHGDYGQEFLIGGYAGTVLGLGWAKGRVDKKTERDYAALQYKALKDHKLDNASIIEQLKNPKASLQARLELLKSLGPERRMALLKAKGQTAALVAGVLISGYLAVNFQDVPQAIFDQLCGGLFGPLIAFKATSTEVQGYAKKARTLASQQVKAEEHLRRQEREVRKAEMTAGAARAAAVLAKNSHLAAKLDAKADKAEASAKAARTRFKAAEKALHAKEKEQNAHFEEMVAALAAKAKAQKIDGFEKILTSHLDKKGVAPQSVSAELAAATPPEAAAVDGGAPEVISDVAPTRRKSPRRPPA